MKLCWKQRSSQPELLVLFNGWGCDETLFANISAEKRDFLILSDYTAMDDVDFGFLHDYHAVAVLAWSFGVFAASVLLFDQFKSMRSVAVNGTPCPIDDRFGIPREIFYGTLNSYDETNRRKFERRMVGRSQHLLSDTLPFSQRTTESQLHELAALAKRVDEKSESLCPAHSSWSLALIADRDRIFPPENMKNYWGDKGISMPGDHLPDFQTIIDRYCFSHSPDRET